MLGKTSQAYRQIEDLTRELTDGVVVSIDLWEGDLPKGKYKREPNHFYTLNKKQISSPTYTSYVAMLRRCYDKKFHKYPKYGARGIKVQRSWVTGNGTLSGFQVFLKDMGERPPNTTLDRKHTDIDHYTKNTCTWQPAHVQAWHKIKTIKSNTGIYGVYFRRNHYEAYISVKGKRIEIGVFKTAKEAMEARDRAAKQLHGEYAVLNKETI